MENTYKNKQVFIRKTNAEFQRKQDKREDKWDFVKRFTNFKQYDGFGCVV